MNPFELLYMLPPFLEIRMGKNRIKDLCPGLQMIGGNIWIIYSNTNVICVLSEDIAYLDDLESEVEHWSKELKGKKYINVTSFFRNGKKIEQ